MGAPGVAQLRAQAVSGPVHEIRGLAVYEKIPVASTGLDLEAPRIRPIRGAGVEALDPISGAIVTVAETDARGRFVLSLPSPGRYRVRVVSRLVAGDVFVMDNTRDDAIWSVSAEAMTGDPLLLWATDRTRAAGAFNILDVIRRANAFVRTLEDGIGLPPLTIFWSPLNTDDPETLTGSFVGGTRFDSQGNYAVVLGDRQRDSDEFDDDVILHEYAHFLAARFSRDDSIGGPHAPGDVLDPRVAWSEGWANFFSALVRADPVYRDAYYGRVLEYDLESNLPGSEPPGYWSERTVHAFLWDLADDGQDSGDSIQVDPRALWNAFRQLADDAFVYFPTFLDRLAAGGALDAPALEQLARIHSLDYRVGSGRRGAPSFPRVIEGRTATGEVDSWSAGRTNLARSAHLYTFYTTGGAVTLDLEITGPGYARNPAANDLDLYLMDERGRLLRGSNSGGNGEPERIATFLPEGTYVVEIRSFFGRGSPRRPAEFNSGAYRLTVNRP
jgi:hypothetical protein